MYFWLKINKIVGDIVYKVFQQCTLKEKYNIIEDYNKLKKSIRTLACIRSNNIKKGIHTQQDEDKYILDLASMQSKYTNFEIQYICNECGKMFNLSLNQFKKLVKDINYPLCCSKSCATRLKDNLYYKSISKEDLINRNNKIRNTILTKCNKDEEYKKLSSENGKKGAAIYWSNKTPKQRSLINKKSAIKAKQTKLTKYGNCNYNNSIKARETYKSRYTPNNPAKNWNHLSEEVLTIIRDKDLFKQAVLKVPKDNRCIYTIAQSLGISDSYCNTLIIKYGLYEDKDIIIHRNISIPQLELTEFIRSIYSGTIIENTKRIISPYEIDIYLPDVNVGIEYNGNYYHCILNVDKELHYKKSKLCEEKGIRLIHIWEYEWNNPRQNAILKNIIKNALNVNEHKVYARNLIIEERSSSSMKDFFNSNNIQGFRGGKTAICLVDKNTREVYMSYIMGSCFFGKGKYEWEVIRGATKLGYTVIGGASRIWKYFIQKYNPNSCVYYVDYNYFNGNSIKNIPGMKFIKTQGSFKNYFLEEDVVKNRDPIHNKQIKELQAEGKVYPIYNAGTKVYVWTK